ncbi:alpha/beta hydrolase [Rugosimonospora acidiphila]|uniref:Alpha/beta hydrolase n=1 Tax=Rugosimonospora acidiphila TaxID=556531 RepID=A0ABP9SE49_9ACTN
MTLAAPVRAFLDGALREPLDFLTLEEQRQFMRHLSDLNYLRYGRRPDPVASVVDHAVPTGAGPVRVREYRPSTGRPLPAHIFLHGGGWWLGAVDELVNDAMCRYRCLRAGCAVLAIDYPLAPRHPFPAAVDAAHAVLSHVIGNPGMWDIDPGSVSVGGVSAGANLVAALALKCRAEGGPHTILQLLEVPVLDLTRWCAPGAPDPDRHHADELIAAVNRYLDGPDPSGPTAGTDPVARGGERVRERARAPLASPLAAPDLSGLPPAHIMTAEMDPLRVDGELYARRLAEAGVAVTLRPCPGAIHGVSFLTRVWPPARQWQRSAAEAVRRAHERTGGAPHRGKGAPPWPTQ